MTDQTFAEFDFDPRLAKAIAQLDFTRPTPVQAKGIPLALAGKDILARARTGSGKTAAYAMPIVQKILLAKQVKNCFFNFYFICIIHSNYPDYLEFRHQTFY